ncbi:MAG: FKBP-type peptidyl-prolyl cis-trans isomerase, partial [Vicinamibacterales bacterium]
MNLRSCFPVLLLISIVTFTVVDGAEQAQPGQLPAPADVAAAPPDAMVTASGLASKILVPGTGTVHPVLASTVKVHYSGWTPDGQMFDSSVVRGQPSSFGVTRV